MGAWLVIVCTFFALTHLATWNPSVKTFAVFFLALGFLAITSFKFLEVI